MYIFQVRSIALFSVLLVLSLLGCGSGRVDLQGPSPYTPDMAISDLQIDGEDGNSMPLKIEQVFSRIAQHNRFFREQPFDFKTFWTLLDSQRKIIEQMKPAERKQIFQKHHLDCQKQTYMSYIKLSLQYKEGYEIHTDPIYSQQECTFPLDKDLTQKSILFLNQKYEDHKQIDWLYLMVQFLNTEYRKNDSKLWLKSINILSPQQWNQIAQTLIQTQSGDQLTDLVNLHLHANGTVPFAKPLAQHLINGDTTKVDTAIHQLGLDGTVSILRFSPLETLDLDKNKSEKIIDNLIRSYEQYPPVRTGVNITLQDRFNTLLGIRELINKFFKIKTKNDIDQLLELERLHRAFESFLILSPGDGLRFLDDQDQQVVDVHWFRYRLWQNHPASIQFTTLQQEFSRLDSELPQDISYLDKVLRSRLRLRFNQNNNLRQELTRHYCSLIGKVELPTSQWNDYLKRADQPGCVYMYFKPKNRKVPYNQAPETFKTKLTIEKDNFVMAHDSALISPGIDVTINSQKVDLSYFDLSSDIEIEDHPVPPTPRSYDGHILPIAIVVNGTGPNNERLGVRTIPLAFVFQDAWSGQKWADYYMSQNHISNGLAGGELLVSATQSSDSFYPSFSSFGGPAQKWATLEVKGGQAWEMKFNSFRFVYAESWFANLQAFPGTIHENLKNQDVQLFEVNTVGQLNDAISFYNSSTDKSLYTPNDSIVNNSEDTLNRYKEACSRLINRNQINPNTLNEMAPGVSRECVNMLVLKAWSWLEQLAQKYQGKQGPLTTSESGQNGVLKGKSGELGHLVNSAQNGFDGRFIREEMQTK